MARAPFQVLVFPYRYRDDETIEYAIFQRNATAGGFWQGIAGGGEDGETPVQAAKRESNEEAAISPESTFIALDSMTTIPVENVTGFLWGDDVLVIPEYSFGVHVGAANISLSDEHQQFRWLAYDEALSLLKWDSNRSALWELNYRLLRRH